MVVAISGSLFGRKKIVSRELPEVDFSDISSLTETYPQIQDENIDYIFVGGSAVQLLMMGDYISGSRIRNGKINNTRAHIDIDIYAFSCDGFGPECAECVTKYNLFAGELSNKTLLPHKTQSSTAKIVEIVSDFYFDNEITPSRDDIRETGINGRKYYSVSPEFSVVTKLSYLAAKSKKDFVDIVGLARRFILNPSEIQRLLSQTSLMEYVNSDYILNIDSMSEIEEIVAKIRRTMIERCLDWEYVYVERIPPLMLFVLLDVVRKGEMLELSTSKRALFSEILGGFGYTESASGASPKYQIYRLALYLLLAKIPETFLDDKTNLEALRHVLYRFLATQQNDATLLALAKQVHEMMGWFTRVPSRWLESSTTGEHKNLVLLNLIRLATNKHYRFESVQWLRNLVKAVLSEKRNALEFQQEIESAHLSLPLSTRTAHIGWTPQTDAHEYPLLRMVELFITTECNLRCGYCYVKGKNSGRKLSYENAKKSVDFLIAESGSREDVRIQFTGGEPTLEFELIKEIIEYAESRAKKSSKKVSFGITTNGTVLTREDLRYYRKHNVGVLLSIDGDPASQDTLRQMKDGGGSFHHLEPIIPSLIQYMPLLEARVTVHPKTADRILANIQFLVSQGIQRFVIAPASGVNWAQEIVETYKTQIIKLADYIKKQQKCNTQIQIELFQKLLECPDPKRLVGCRAGRDAIAISPTGDIYPCSKIMGVTNFDQDFSLGTLDEGISNVRLRNELLEHFPSLSERGYRQELGQSAIGECFANNYQDNGVLFSRSSCTSTFARAYCELRPIIFSILNE